MVSLENISFEFGARWLYRNAGLQIKPGDRMALVGRNGTGKTTLLQLLVGDYAPAEGKISMPRDMRIGFLRQELSAYDSDQSAFGVALLAYDRQIALQEKIQKLIEKLETAPQEKDVHDLASAQEEFERLGGYEMQSRTAAILAGLGFSEEDQRKPFRSFSGGWRMRVLLAQMLLRDPDLLLLDEPTNHLDLPSITWLENYLQSFRGAYIIVSHDRYFLDRLTQVTVEIDREKFNYYPGNYSFYLEEREIRREQHAREYENQQKVISDMERFINRFRAQATKARQAQSKIKMLDKIERIDAPEADAASVSFHFSPSITPGRDILHLHVKNKSYSDRQVLGESEVTVFRGDKIALIGANGLGKSTLLRMIGQMEPFEGMLRHGHNVVPSFFAQHQSESLTPTNSIIEEMDGFVRKKGETFVRSILGGFLFTGDDILKKIKVLSGGEKSRVALAKTLLSDANFLLLDEPTNHLDISSVEILIAALEQYEGTFIAVSHDRWFLNEVANKIWYIENRMVKEYPGTYAEYEAWQEKILVQKKAAESAKTATAAATSEEVKPQPEKKKPGKNTIKKLQTDLENTEKRIAELDAMKAVLIEKMSTQEVASDFSKLSEVQKELHAVETESGTVIAAWEVLVEQLEEINRDV